MKWTALVCAIMVLFSRQAQAVVSLAGTRLVFDGAYREATIEVSNRGDAQVLIQAWLTDARTGQEGKVDLPFVVTPHLAQMPAGGRQTLRVLYEGAGVPEDRETLLHLYVLEVPRRSEARQQLNIAVRQRINVFYRPAGLPGDPAHAAQAVAWRWQAGDRSAIKVRNPTPFHVSLQNVTLNGVEVSEDVMLEPLSEQTLALPASLTFDVAPGRLRFKALTDYGGLREFCAQTQNNEPFSARLRTPGDPPSTGKC